MAAARSGPAPAAKNLLPRLHPGEQSSLAGGYADSNEAAPGQNFSRFAIAAMGERYLDLQHRVFAKTGLRPRRYFSLLTSTIPIQEIRFCKLAYLRNMCVVNQIGAKLWAAALDRIDFVPMAGGFRPECGRRWRGWLRQAGVALRWEQLPGGERRGTA